MTGADGVAVNAIAVILAMAVVNAVLRTGGYWLMGHVPLTDRVRRMLEALPGSVIMATVLPIAVKSGGPAMLAIGTAGVVMFVVRNDFAAVVAGVAVAALARAAGM